MAAMSADLLLPPPSSCRAVPPQIVSYMTLSQLYQPMQVLFPSSEDSSRAEEVMTISATRFGPSTARSPLAHRATRVNNFWSADLSTSRNIYLQGAVSSGPRSVTGYTFSSSLEIGSLGQTQRYSEPTGPAKSSLGAVRGFRPEPPVTVRGSPTTGVEPVHEHQIRRLYSVDHHGMG